MKKLLALSLAATMFLVPQVSFAEQTSDVQLDGEALVQKGSKVIFKADEIKDAKEILKKAKKLSKEEIKAEGMIAKSSNKDEKVKLNVHRWEQKLEAIQNPDGSIVEKYAVNTIADIGTQSVSAAAAEPTGTYSNDPSSDIDSTSSVKTNMTYYYYIYKDGINNTTVWIKGHAFYASFTKLDSQVSGITQLTLSMYEQGNLYGGGRLGTDVIINNPIASPVFGTNYYINVNNYAPFHYVNTTDGISGNAGYFKATFKRGTSGTLSFTAGISKGAAAIPW
ncbi:hypothetical protein [Aneurinibacillus tyrosinisolvens]|uniref:hypothetical protein n=1 Tax=Aneurinibacillus tyrosinisolvens TaxID=1443435 RepID=UPI00063FCE0B|nr:hypothetical protein [Aneurinibacillus tyrosinisolvens]